MFTGTVGCAQCDTTERCTALCIIAQAAKTLQSAYGALSLPTKEKMGEACIITGYYFLNKNIQFNKPPLLKIDNLLNKLANPQVFSKVDLTNILLSINSYS